jgi:hypothetical protein
MQSIDNLYILLKNYMSVEDVLYTLKEFSKIDSIVDNRNIENFIYEKCQELELCPKCFSKLNITKHKEHRGEYLGQTCYQNVVEVKCENCNYID